MASPFRCSCKKQLRNPEQDLSRISRIISILVDSFLPCTYPNLKNHPLSRFFGIPSGTVIVKARKERRVGHLVISQIRFDQQLASTLCSRTKTEARKTRKSLDYSQDQTASLSHKQLKEAKPMASLERISRQAFILLYALYVSSFTPSAPFLLDCYFCN